MPHADPERRRAYSAAYYQANRGTLDAGRAERTAADPERRRQVSRESARRVYASDLDTARIKGRAARASFRARNGDRLADEARAWRKDNPDLHNSNTSRWRAKVAGATTENVDRRLVWLRDKGMCGICLTRVTSKNWQMDHVMPLSKGGEHCYGNVQVSHGLCNQRKSNQWFFDLVPVPVDKVGTEGME